MKKTSVKKVLSILPRAMAVEIEAIVGGRPGGDEGLGEVRLIASGQCSLIHNRETVILRYSPTAEEIEEIVNKTCSGGMYAFRDTVKNGYIPMGGGVRVGISGAAGYDEGRLVGVSRVSTLVFRFPVFRCDFGDRLIRIYRRGIGRGMLIYSPPGVGKTTALRALAEVISRESRLCIVDERQELDAGGLSCASVLSGYEKALGIEIALRTHSPQIIMVDEIGAGEAEALSAVLGAGIPIIATAHGGSTEDLLTRSATERLVTSGFFSVFVGIYLGSKGYRLKRTPFSKLSINDKDSVSDAAKKRLPLGC